MKKIVKYLTIVIFCLYTVYLAYYEFGLFSRYNYFTAKEDLKKGDFSIIQYGLTIPSEGRYIIQNKYNVNIDYKGCVINDITNGLYYYNEVKRDYYREKYGSDFWERYYKEIDEYDDSISKVSIEERVIHLISNLNIVLDKSKIVDSLSKHKRKLKFEVFTKDSLSYVYGVKVFEYNDKYYYTHFNFFVDIRIMHVINPSGQLEDYERFLKEYDNNLQKARDPIIKL